MNFWNKFCGFVLIFFLAAHFSTAQATANHSLLVPVNKVFFSATNIYLNKNLNQKIISSPSLALVAPNYYTQHLGFMCKRELALEKVTKIPLRIRLGSLQQCNYLEGKR